jgi:hypothetical protein
MATTTIVITHAGTEPAEEVSSFTSGGTAYGSLTAAEKITAMRLMKKAVKRCSADYGSTFAPKGG